MQIVIDIPEREYKVICENNYVAVCACPNLLSNAIKNGTVLPKHGRLIDADAQDLRAELWTFTRYTGIDEMPYEDATQTIDNAPTILEAWGNEE